MDPLDVAILRQLIQEDAASPLSSNPLRSLRSIARDLEVDKETVRQRLLRLRERQVIRPSTVMVNPVLVGLRVAHFWTDGIPLTAKPAVLSQLQARPKAILVNDYVGNAAYLLELHPETMSPERLKNSLMQIPGVQDVLYSELSFPPSDLELGSLDWRIVRGLQENPSTSYVALAERVGLSPRTVRRRLQRMIEGKALFVVPRFQLEALESSIADLAVFYDDAALKSTVDQRVLSKLTNVLARAELHNRGFSFFNLVMDNVARARGLLNWVESQPGVRTARLDFVQDRIELFEHMNRVYDERSGPAE